MASRALNCDWPYHTREFRGRATSAGGIHGTRYHLEIYDLLNSAKNTIKTIT